jgi:signal transduction histidine kinase
MEGHLEMINRTRTNLITVCGPSLALIILALLGWLTYRDISAAMAAYEEVDHTYTILQKLDEVFSALKDAEAGQRGYVITGEQKYLGPYYEATVDVNQGIVSLQGLTKNNPRHRRALEGIGLAMNKELAMLKETIEIRRTKGYRAATRFVETGAAEKLMDTIREKVTEVQDEETRLLKERLSTRGVAARRLIGAIFAGGALSLTLLLIAFLFLKKEIIKRIKVEEELRRHQESLEDIVAGRTRDLAVANSHLKEEIAMRERAEHELRKTMRDLAHSNKELDQFASVASHDLQSPLLTVAGFIELLAKHYKGRFDEKADNYIDHIMNGTRRMSVLIHDLYVYSRIGTKGKQFSKVSMSALLNDAVDNLKDTIDKNKAVITFDVLPEVEGDKTQLIQLFQNLIGNALKFRKKDVHPSIRISVERKQSEWVFGVHDNGIGIESRFYERIFIIFQRLSTVEEYSGTGLGLALCKKIVERHGGRIWVESQPGEGSSFYFTVPMVQMRDEVRSDQKCYGE